MNNEIIFLVEDSIEGGYEAKALSHPIFTEADTLDELHMIVKDAVHCHFDDHPSTSLGHRERPKIICRET